MWMHAVQLPAAFDSLHPEPYSMKESIIYKNMKFVCRHGLEHAGAIDYARPLSEKLGRHSGVVGAV